VERFGKPNQGYIFDMMKKTRINFKYVFRQCKKREASIAADNMADHLSHKDYNSFWREIDKINTNNTPLATKVGKAQGEVEITSLWKGYFETLLNSSKVADDKVYVEETINNCEGKSDITISVIDIQRALTCLKAGKSAGSDDLVSEHLMYAGNRTITLLVSLFNMILTHGYMPDRVMNTTLVPLVKDKAGDIADVNNYRPIALSTVISKLFEYTILDKIETTLYTTDNQFGFKKNVGTEMCIVTLKQVLQLYKKHNTPVYCCFLDLSKAYDRVNHWTLFRKLIERKIPSIIVRILLFWYSNQQFCVRWGQCVSNSFKVTNGVRQGSVLSPHLFNVYTDELSTSLNKTNTGCQMNGVTINHLCYADDMVIMATTPAALQTLINQCQEYAGQHELVYSDHKCRCMLFNYGEQKVTSTPKIYINDMPVRYIDTWKYLGYFITNNGKDDKDIKRHMRGVYMRANQLVRKFGQCSYNAKVLLFKAYCTSTYCFPIWDTYNDYSMNHLRVAYNNAARKILGYDYRCSASGMCVENDVPSFGELQRKIVFSFKSRVEQSRNQYILLVLQSNYIAYSSSITRWYNMLCKKPAGDPVY